MGIRIRTLGRDARGAFAGRIAALEEDARYPLGDDSFGLDHGPDYFAFFDRLGEVTYEVALDGERVVAVSARVLRELAWGERVERCWYLCDLKVHPEYRGRHLPFRMAAHALPSAYARCPRGYGISMNPGDGSENRVARMLRRMKILPLSVACELELFSLDADAMARAAPVVEAHRGPVGYLSLRGVKDVVLVSTGAPMPLLHVQFGPTAERDRAAPTEGAVHMFCAPKGDPLASAIRGLGMEVDATATVLAHGMAASDFRFVLTSEI